jgi:hypothetical protein
MSKNWRAQNKKFGQVGNNTSRGTLYEMGLDFISLIKPTRR